LFNFERLNCKKNKLSFLTSEVDSQIKNNYFEANLK
jgi:hypothetical protein